MTRAVRRTPAQSLGARPYTRQRALLRLFAFLALFQALFCLTACWDYREISSTTFVAGAAFDLDPLGGYILTAEVIDFTGVRDGGAPETVRITSRGATLPEAADHAMRAAGKRLYWSHAAAFIVSRDFAAQGITPLTDFLLHNIDTGLTASLLVSALPTAHEVLDLQTAGGGAVSYEIRSIMQNNAYFSQTVADFAYKTMQALNQGGTCAALAMVSSYEQDGETCLDLSGCAVFDGCRLAAELDAGDTPRLLALRGQPIGGTLALPEKACTLRLLDTRTVFTPRQDPDGTLRMEVTLEAGMVVSSAETLGAHADPGIYETLERAAETRIRQRIRELTDRAQQELGLDIFGFGVRFRQAMPEAWPAWEGDWNRRFREMEIVPEARVRIERSSAGPAILTPEG